MKWIKALLMVTVSVGMLGIVGCGDDDDSSPVSYEESELYGDWEETGGGGPGGISISENGDVASSVGSGKWDLVNDQFTITQDDGSTVVGTITSLDDDQMTIKWATEGTKSYAKH